MFRIYDLRSDGVYIPIRYYAKQNGRAAVLVGMLHVGERSYYKTVEKILKKCGVVIYEQVFIRNAETMKQLDDEWKSFLYAEDLDEAFLGAIYLPMPPQKFMYDHGLVEESHHFDYTQVSWISGDGAWENEGKDDAFSDKVWEEIRKSIKKVDQKLKQEKVLAAKEFLCSVDAGSATMLKYISFRNLYEEEIQKAVHCATIVDVRDEMTFGVFDTVIDTKKPARIGIKFGNGHMNGMDKLLRDRGYVLTTVKWLRALAI